jgi:hypothetical protein
MGFPGAMAAAAGMEESKAVGNRILGLLARCQLPGATGAAAVLGEQSCGQQEPWGLLAVAGYQEP